MKGCIACFGIDVAESSFVAAAGTLAGVVWTHMVAFAPHQRLGYLSMDDELPKEVQLFADAMDLIETQESPVKLKMQYKLY